MAGLGQRFRDEGYALPKPLIDVSGMPMVMRAVRDLPPAERQTFIVHPDHVREHAIDVRLKEFFPAATVIVAPGLTAGQACTVRLASAAVSQDEEVLIAACDNTHLYDPAKFAALRADLTIDAMIWTYRHDPRVLLKPTAHGWVHCSPPPGGRTDSLTEVRPRKSSTSQSYTPLTVWLLRLDVAVAHGRPYHPQTQGKEERFHRTLSLELLSRRSFRDLADCRRQFAPWRDDYNLRRPHQALGMETPADRSRVPRASSANRVRQSPSDASRATRLSLAPGASDPRRTGLRRLPAGVGADDRRRRARRAVRPASRREGRLTRRGASSATDSLRAGA
jgi:hypothetical protein